MNQLPLTIVLPNYNHAHFLPMAIESVLSQTFSDFELLIVDDGSTDRSVEVIEEYIQKDRRIKLLRHQKNCGIAAAYATAIGQTQGQYLHQFSATDCYLPGFLEKSMRLLLEHKKMGLCCTDVGLFDNIPSLFTRNQLIQQAHTPLLFHPHEITKIFKYARFNIPGLCSIVKTSSYIRHGGYRPNLHFMCDWFVNHCIALFEGALYIPETLIVYREPEYTKKSSSQPHIRQEALNTLLNLLLQSKNGEILRRMKQAASLGILGKERIGAILKHPSLWSLYIGLAQRHFYTKLVRFRKPPVSSSFLNRYAMKLL